MIARVKQTEHPITTYIHVHMYSYTAEFWQTTQWNTPQQPVNIHIYINVYIYVCVCLCVCVYVYIYMYVQ